MLAIHSLHFRVHTRVLLTLLIALAATAALWAEPEHRQLLREAGAAQRDGNLPLMLEKLEAIRAQRPDYPRILFVLARGYTAADRAPEALATLDALARMGVTGNISGDAALAPLRSLPEFSALAERFAANAGPMGTADPTHRLLAQSGIIESIAIDSRGRQFFGDVHNRCIWVRDTEGELTQFSNSNDGLLGVFGLALDERRGVLWAGVSAVPEMKGFTSTVRGWGYLAEYDLATAAFRRSLQVPSAGGPHVLGSIRLAPDGSVLATDSFSPVIWRAAPNATQLEPWLEHGDFVSLQGLDFSPDGRTLYVADYANGIWSIDVATRSPTLLKPAADATLFGIDDLHFVNGQLLGVQNGVNPARLVRITIQPDGPAQTQVLLQRHADMVEPATGTIHAGKFHFIGNSGWAVHEGAATPPAPRDVAVLALAL